MRLLALHNVLVASDLTSTSDGAMRTALALSRRCGARLHAVHVAPQSAEPREDERRFDDLARLDTALRGIGAFEDEFLSRILTGDVVSSIRQAADSVAADVVVLGRGRGHSAGTSAQPLGSTAHAVMSRSLTPCLATAQPLGIPVRKALVAIDRSDSARGALLVALSWVSALRVRDGVDEQSRLVALHVDSRSDAPMPPTAVDQKTIEHEVTVLQRNAEAWAGVIVHSETMDAREPAATIADYARDGGFQLVVLGTRRPERREDGLGSVSAAVAGRVAMPVLLVPPAVWRNHAKDIDYF